MGKKSKNPKKAGAKKNPKKAGAHGNDDNDDDGPPPLVDQPFSPPGGGGGGQKDDIGVRITQGQDPRDPQVRWMRAKAQQILDANRGKIASNEDFREVMRAAWEAQTPAEMAAWGGRERRVLTSGGFSFLFCLDLLGLLVPGSGRHLPFFLFLLAKNSRKWGLYKKPFFFKW